MNSAIQVELEGVLARWNVYLAPKVRTNIAEEIAQIIERRERPLLARIRQLEREAREPRR